VFARLVVKEVVDAILFHEPADEVEVGLAELHAVLPDAVAATQTQFIVAEAVVTEDLLDDGRGVEMLIDAAVAGAGKEPGPGPQHGLVVIQVADDADLDELRDEGVEKAHTAVDVVQLDIDPLAEEVAQGDSVVLAEQIGPAFEQPPQFIFEVDTVDLKLVRAQWGHDADLTLRLLKHNHADLHSEWEGSGKP
jgi:hypothetical protein